MAPAQRKYHNWSKCLIYWSPSLAKQCQLSYVLLICTCDIFCWTIHPITLEILKFGIILIYETSTYVDTSHVPLFVPNWLFAAFRMFAFGEVLLKKKVRYQRLWACWQAVRNIEMLWYCSTFHLIAYKKIKIPGAHYIVEPKSAKNTIKSTMSCPNDNGGNNNGPNDEGRRQRRSEETDFEFGLRNSNSLYRHLLGGLSRPPLLNLTPLPRPMDPVQTITAALAVIQDCDIDDVEFSLGEADETSSTSSSRSSSSSSSRNRNHYHSNSKHRDSSGYRRQ